MRRRNPNKERYYPGACLSACCGYIKTAPECQACPHRAALDAFEAWVERTGAEPADPIWSRTLFVVPGARS